MMCNSALHPVASPTDWYVQMMTFTVTYSSINLITDILYQGLFWQISKIKITVQKCQRSGCKKNQAFNFPFAWKWWGEILIYSQRSSWQPSYFHSVQTHTEAVFFYHLLTLSRSSFIFVSLPSVCLLVSLHILAVFSLSWLMKTLPLMKIKCLKLQI